MKEQIVLHLKGPIFLSSLLFSLNVPFFVFSLINFLCTSVFPHSEFLFFIFLTVFSFFLSIRHQSNVVLLLPGTDLRLHTKPGVRGLIKRCGQVQRVQADYPDTGHRIATGAGSVIKACTLQVAADLPERALASWSQHSDNEKYSSVPLFLRVYLTPY